MTEFKKDTRVILSIAQKLADKGIFQTTSSLNIFNFGGRKVRYTLDYELNEIQFYIQFNDLWTNEYMAKIVADIFNKYGFNAHAESGWGCVWVKTELENDLIERIESCFKNGILNEDLHEI